MYDFMYTFSATCFITPTDLQFCYLIYLRCVYIMYYIYYLILFDPHGNILRWIINQILLSDSEI